MASQEEFVKLMRQQTQIRNIAIAAHIDHGKTTFSDNLLAGAGMLSEETAGKQRALDFHEDEATRGITIDSASVSMLHKVNGEDYFVSVIDSNGCESDRAAMRVTLLPINDDNCDDCDINDGISDNNGTGSFFSGGVNINFLTGLPFSRCS